MRKHQFEGAEMEGEAKSGKERFTYHEIVKWSELPISMNGSPHLP